MFERILIVCVGNICRSPLGEAMFKQAFPNKQIFSAGIATERSHLSGKSADETMQQVANEHLIDLSSHCAKQLTEEDCKNADLILVMEKGHIEQVENIAEGSRGKVMLFGHWLGRDIPDPYQQSREAFDFVYVLMNQATESWQTKLK